MKIPIISVIIPVYNAGQYLHACVDSVLAQSMKDFELILVDDGSTDNSREICEEAAVSDDRVRVFSKENGGVSSARNMGIRQAQGTWITFVDADDTVAPDYLQILCAAADGTVSRSSLILSGIRTFWIRRGVHERTIAFADACFFKGNPDFKEFIKKLYFQPGYLFSKLFNRNLLKDFGLFFDEKISFSEDKIFILNYLKIANCVKSVSGAGYNHIWRNNEGLSFRYSKFESECHSFKTIVDLIESLWGHDAILRDFSHNLRSRLKRSIMVLYLPDTYVVWRERIACLHSLREWLVGQKKISSRELGLPSGSVSIYIKDLCWLTKYFFKYPMSIFSLKLKALLKLLISSCSFSRKPEHNTVN